MGATFSDRLTMVLKALSIGRAPLAAAVGVDKSLISRWCSGQVVPSEHNRARLTQFIAGHQAGFSMLDWELPLDELAAKLGVAAPAPVKLAPGLADWVPPAMLVEAAANVQLHGASYEGFWRSTRPSSEAPGQFIHEHILLRRRDDGMLGMWLGIMDITYVGWSIPIGTKLFSIATDTTTGTFAFSIFNGVTRQRAEVVDGLILTCMRDAGVTPIASKCLLERIGDVSGDATADEARLAELAQTYPLSPAADIAEHVRNHLWSDTGPAAFAAGGDTILMMALARSMSRGASYEDQRKPAV